MNSDELKQYFKLIAEEANVMSVETSDLIYYWKELVNGKYQITDRIIIK